MLLNEFIGLFVGAFLICVLLEYAIGSRIILFKAKPEHADWSAWYLMQGTTIKHLAASIKDAKNNTSLSSTLTAFSKETLYYASSGLMLLGVVVLISTFMFLDTSADGTQQSGMLIIPFMCGIAGHTIAHIFYESYILLLIRKTWCDNSSTYQTLHNCLHTT